MRAFERIGMQPLTCYYGPSGRTLYTDITINNVKLRMCIDTGSTNCVIDSKLIKRLGLNVLKVTREASFLGGNQAVNFILVRNARTSDGEPLPPNFWLSFDMSAARQLSKGEGEPECDGLLGYDFLVHHAGVVFSDSSLVMMRYPHRVERGLQGTWELVRCNPAQPSLPEPISLTISELDARLRFGLNVFKYKIAIGLGTRPRTLYVVDNPGPDQFRLCRYALIGETLVISGPVLPADDVKVRPATLSLPKPGQPKYSVLTFRRAKPELAPMPHVAR